MIMISYSVSFCGLLMDPYPVRFVCKAESKLSHCLYWQCWQSSFPWVDCTSLCIGQLGWGSGAWARPPQLNWSHVLQSLEQLLSLHRPLWCWACGGSRKGRARVPGMQGGDLFTPSSPSGSPPLWHMAPWWQGHSTVVAPQGELALLSGEKTFLRRI